MIANIGLLKIIKTGPGTSIQDMGRKGFAAYGIPLSGGLDLRSLSWVNHLLKNKDSDAALEICQPGLKIEFDAPTLICFGGAQANLLLNGALIPSYGLIRIKSTDQLEIGAFHQGSVLYLGIKNGFQTEVIMNSRSWFSGLTDQGIASKEALITYTSYREAPIFTASKVKWNFNWASNQMIGVYPGPEWDSLDNTAQKLIESMEFTVSELKNRMAIQLKELLPNRISEMPTAPVFPGTVQLTSGGKLIILMKDAQVTGGYPRILQVSEEGLAVLSQKNPREKIKFQLIRFY